MFTERYPINIEKINCKRPKGSKDDITAIVQVSGAVTPEQSEENEVLATYTTPDECREFCTPKTSFREISLGGESHGRSLALYIGPDARMPKVEAYNVIAGKFKLINMSCVSVILQMQLEIPRISLDDIARLISELDHQVFIELRAQQEQLPGVDPKDLLENELRGREHHADA